MNLPAPFGPGFAQIRTAALRAVIVCLVAVAWPHAAAAQAFQVTGGSSSMLDAEGGSFEVHAQNYTARIDLGYLGRPSLGFYFARAYKTATLGAGDQIIPFVLPTDLFNSSFFFLGRGLSDTQPWDGGKLFVFAGETSNAYQAPFLNVARNDTPAGAIFYEKKLSPSLRFVSRNIFSQRQTSIQAVEWAARKDIKAALSAGIGNNQSYGSSSYSMNERWMSLDASYTLEGNAFRRVIVATPQISENDRDNIRFDFHPINNFRVVVSRNNYLASFAPNVFERATVDGLAASIAFAGFQTYGSLFESATSQGNSSALAFGVRRMITRHFEAGIDDLRSKYSGNGHSETILGNFREIVNSRLSVTETVTHTNGQTSVDFGGNFVSNFLTLSVDYQTLFLPFLLSNSGQFKQVMVVGLHLQLPHGVQFNLDTDVTPLGQVQYTTYASTYAYRGAGPSSSGTSFSGAFFQNIVRGEVLDPDGQPIEGVAVQIGPEVAVTDSEGNFMVRVKKSGELALKIAFDDFTAPGKYAIVQAPQTVKATRKESAQEYSIVLRRLPNAVTTADPSHQTDLPDTPPNSK